MLTEKERKTFEINNDYIYLLVTMAFYIIILCFVNIFEYKIYEVFPTDNILILNITLEIIGVILSFIIFNGCYYSYQHLKRLRLLVLAITFFTTGVLGFFHILSYQSISYIFEESSVVLASTNWIVVRLLIAIGIFITSIINFDYKVKLNKNIILFLEVIIVSGAIYISNFRIDLIKLLFLEGQEFTLLKNYIAYIIIILHMTSIFFYLKTYKIIQNKYVIILCCGLILSILCEAQFRLYEGIFDIYYLLGHLYRITAIYLIYYSIFKYNIDIPYKEIKKAKDRIKLYASNLEKIVDKRTQEIKKVNERILQEIDYARNIQQSLLPSNELSFKGIDFLANYFPCERLSGDFYDIFEIDENNIGMYILDVSGHGVPAALLTMLSTYFMKSITKCESKVLTPDKHLEGIYNEFNNLRLPNEIHIVIFYAVYNNKNKVLTYCSGGMNCYPILFRKDKSYEFLDKSHGFPICQCSDFFTPQYVKGKIQLNRGDRIIFYTDGLTDKNKNKVLNEESLIDIMLNSKDKSIRFLNNEINSRVKKIENLDDDITYFIMEVN